MMFGYFKKSVQTGQSGRLKEGSTEHKKEVFVLVNESIER